MSQAALGPLPVEAVPSAGARLSVFDERSLDYEAVVWRSVDEIDLAAWDALRDPHDVFMDVRLLRAVEVSMARDASFKYILFRDAAGAPAASACVCTYAVDGTVLVEEGIAKRIACGLKKLSPRLLEYKIVFLGLPFSGGQSHLRFAEKTDRGAIMRRLDGMLRTIAREDGAKCIVLKEFKEHELPGVDIARELGYLQADSLPMNQLELTQGTYDAWLASLHNKKRYEVRKSMKKLSEGGVRWITTSDPDEVERLITDHVHRLYLAVVGRSDTKLELLPPAFFHQMVRQLPNNCEICLAMKDDTVLAFGLCLYNEQEYHPLFLGIDYERNRDYDLYFNVMYRSLEDAHRHRTSLVVLGQNADECKTTKLGSSQTRRYFFIKGVGVVREHLLRLLSKQLFPARPMSVPFTPAARAA